jgi:dTDP-4-dehydrorhamnose reductase
MVNGKNSILPVELWGGIECTVNRVKDEYLDQVIRSGHEGRPGDLERIAATGIRTLRYPVLWERTAPQNLASPDWRWPDERLAKLRELGITPIVGLVHHGSGPRYASIEHPSFVDGLAAYAGMVARRYPWVEYYTPVNEPVTTARFCGLYGHWFPHGRSTRSFLRLLYHECKGTVLAMQEIRKVRPDAKLVQTEDLGQTHSTPLLAYQAEYENYRRWLSFDLLCGRVTPGHWMWGHLRSEGLKEEELAFFWENPCPPDLLGINHYLTSERFLDERIKHYPPHLAGGNGRHRYVDSEAVRIPEVKREGAFGLIMQAWERYHIPIAITEVHLGCTREDHMRWFYQVWQSANQLKASGVDLRAVTAWALLGSYDWDSLLVHTRHYYEPGLLDLRSPEPRPTGLCNLISEITRTGGATHPILEGKGWWQRDDRWIKQADFAKHLRGSTNATPVGRPVLITGASGTLGNAFAHICTSRGIAYRLVGRQEMDITDPAQIRQVLQEIKPWAVINTAGYVKAAEAEREAERCYRENHRGAVQLATACRDAGIGYLTFSSDLVFNGTKGAPYVESDPVDPGGVYGASKAAAEKDVLALLPSALIIRTSAFFGPWDDYNFATVFLRRFAAADPFDVAAHLRVSPTYVVDLVHASLDLLLDGAAGIWHLANRGDVSWADFARLVARKAGLPEDQVQRWYDSQLQKGDGLPVQSTVLGSERAWLLPPLEHAVDRYLRDSTVLQKLLQEA